MGKAPSIHIEKVKMKSSTYLFGLFDGTFTMAAMHPYESTASLALRDLRLITSRGHRDSRIRNQNFKQVEQTYLHHVLYRP